MVTCQDFLVESCPENDISRALGGLGSEVHPPASPVMDSHGVYIRNSRVSVSVLW